ncbi:origin recognition complex subunit 3 isoform X2 [Meriones unguiculatus]|uniref:origin recognition complex subunit 3 isoform X2 n=1 Tax=Meriones unguiculatus TaxID=10047 RepID=UPI00108551A3|nr:origin recognition complex subunit 3 isoform X2 [Meriones unguiculatus]
MGIGYGSGKSRTRRLAQGCFVFKPDFKKRKISVPIEDYFNHEKLESEDSKLRFETYHLLWQRMKSETEQLQEKLSENLFDSLVEFLQKSHSEFQKHSKNWGCHMKLREIPTAALILGVNVTDHNLIFRSLTETLQNNVTPYVVSLQAKDCPDVRHFLQKLTSQLMDCCVESESEEGKHVKIPRKTNDSMDSLSSWYATVTQKTCPKITSKKRTTTSGQWQSPPVVLILKNMESFSTKVLQDFIIISSQHLHEFPLILIFGIATSPVIIQRLLPHAVSSLLCVELFQSLSCKEHLTVVLDKLLLTAQFPFKISKKALQVLTNVFLYHDFSIQNFIKGLKLSLLEHFYSQPLSVLCCDLPEAKKRINFFSVNQCENVRRLPSFRRYVEKQPSEKQVALLTSETVLKEETQSLLENLHVYHINYFLVLRCLHNFISSLPKYPLGRQIRELYCTCLEQKIWDSEEYASALQLLRMLAKDELMSILQKCIEVLNSSTEMQLGNTTQKIKDFLMLFQNLDDSKEDEDACGSQIKGLQKTDLYHLQKSLLEMKESRRTAKKQTKFEVLRENVVNFIDSLVRDYLVPPESQPLHEVVYFSGAHTLREHLNAAPRIALHTALNNPYYYLKNEALKSEEGCIPNSAPDICIAYKLHLECSRLINLVDWSEAFATVVTAAEKMDANSTTSEEMSEIIHARFIRAVSELELLGFIKPTKKKTDHVARLTWGGC